MTEHPTPWRVEYWRRCPEWHEKSCPYIVDANGVEVIYRMKQYVNHPGIYDELADKTARQIVSAVNYQAQQQEFAVEFANTLIKSYSTNATKPVINE